MGSEHIKCVVFLCCCTLVFGQKFKTIHTRLGEVTGTLSSLHGKKIVKFLGIPFAKPPIGDHKLSKPQPFGIFGRLNATQYPPSCIQRVESAKRYTGQEDCLMLNIFTPLECFSHDKTAVMVYIHGGGNEFGDSSDFPGDVFSAIGQVVLVTIQYRLGAFGFFSTGNSYLPGNLGLWDQHQAFLWVKENINDYGGNPAAITIFGYMAGANDVAYQLFSPYNNGSLFQRAIIQNPIATAPDYVGRDPSDLSRKIAVSLNCSLGPDFVSCLNSRNSSEFIKQYNNFDVSFKSFAIADNDFLSRDLGFLNGNLTSGNFFMINREMIGNFADYDIMGGWGDQPGFQSLAKVSLGDLTQKLYDGMSEEEFSIALTKWPFFTLRNRKCGDVIFNTLKNFYMQDPKPKVSDGRSTDDQRLEAYTRMASDMIYKGPLLQMLQLHAKVSKKANFLYENNVRRAGSPWFPFDVYGGLEGIDWLRTGADGIDDIGLVFGFPFFKDVYSDFTNSTVENKVRNLTYSNVEKEISRKLISFYTNFSKKGHPGKEFELFGRNQKYTKVTSSGCHKDSYPINDAYRLFSSITTATQ